MSSNTIVTPHPSTLTNASSLSIEYDKPIHLDYYMSSLQRQCKLVKTQDGSTILYKNNEEFTSPLNKVFQIDASANANGSKDIICISENSVYIVHSTILQK